MTTGSARPSSDSTREAVRTLLGEFLLVVLFSTAIAVFFAALGTSFRGAFRDALINSQCIGVSGFVLGRAFARLARPGTPAWLPNLVAVPCGIALGIWCASFWTRSDLLDALVAINPQVIGSTLFGGLLFGVAIAYFFQSRDAMLANALQLKEEKLQKLHMQQLLTEANLKLVQAQIEPHFLFNTLSNIIQLVDTEPSAARRTLVNLTSYLRATLQRTRSGRSTLGEEFELVQAYLEIQAVRMGDRLRFHLEFSPDLREVELPPLLIQPLVENAVRHGLEPKASGGTVWVRASQSEDVLVLEVSDSGLGLSSNSPPGIGLANVRARIQAMSKGRGQMILQPNLPEGLRVRISLPLATPGVSD